MVLIADSSPFIIPQPVKKLLLENINETKFNHILYSLNQNTNYEFRILVTPKKVESITAFEFFGQSCAPERKAAYS